MRKVISSCSKKSIQQQFTLLVLKMLTTTARCIMHMQSQQFPLHILQLNAKNCTLYNDSAIKY